MIVLILIVIIIAKIKKYKILPAFKVYDLYPFLVLEIIYWFLQILVWNENYSFLKYAIIIQKSFLLSMMIPIIRRKLFTPALFGVGMIGVGTILNNLVISANGGKMPVFPTFSSLTGYCTKDALINGADSIHIFLDSTTKLNFLADYIDLGFTIYSIGDIFVDSFMAIIVYFTIVAINKSK